MPVAHMPTPPPPPTPPTHPRSPRPPPSSWATSPTRCSCSRSLSCASCLSCAGPCSCWAPRGAARRRSGARSCAPRTRWARRRSTGPSTPRPSRAMSCTGAYSSCTRAHKLPAPPPPPAARLRSPHHTHARTCWCTHSRQSRAACTPQLPAPRHARVEGGPRVGHVPRHGQQQGAVRALTHNTQAMRPTLVISIYGHMPCLRLTLRSRVLHQPGQQAPVDRAGRRH